MGTGFLISADLQQLRQDLGFDPSPIVTAEVSLTGSKYSDNSANKAAFFRQVIQNMQALPGVSSAGATTNIAATGARRFPFRIQGRSEVPTAELPLARYYVISNRYLETIGIPILRGRNFSDSDNEKNPRVILVNKVLAERFFGKEDALGKFIKVETGSADQSGWREIIGIVANVRNWPGQMLDDPQVYECYWQHPTESMTLAARTSSDPGAMARAIQHTIWSVDKDQPVGRLASLTTVISEEKAGGEFAADVFTVFSGLALLLAAIGVYGVAAYSVTQRTREIGIRMALGAQRSHVVRLVLSGSAKLTAFGSAVGLLLAWPLPRMFRATFEGIQINAAWIYIIVPILIASVAMIACSLPARRAATIDPLVALRYE
jgi:putative ABC transport system permease protein